MQSAESTDTKVPSTTKQPETTTQEEQVSIDPNDVNAKNSCATKHLDGRISSNL